MWYRWGGYRGGVGVGRGGLRLTEYLSLQYILHQGLQLQSEYLGNEISAIDGLFARQKVLLDLLPIWVAGERGEEVWTAELGG